MQEIALLCIELVTLKSKIVKGLSNVQTADVTGQAELKGIIANLEAQLDLEHTSREHDKKWYKGALKEAMRKQQDSQLQRALMKNQLVGKDAQVRGLMNTVVEMSDSLGLLGEKIAQL